MYLKVLKRNGVTRLYFYESHYEPSGKKGVRGKVRQEMIESLGNLDDLQKIYDDPIAHFTQVAKDRTAEKKAERTVMIKLDHDEDMDEYVDDALNCGYGILNELYKELELDKFWKYYADKGKTSFDSDAIFRLLVYSRVIFPGSKKAAFDGQGRFFEGFGTFELEDVYRALSVFSKNSERMQEWIFEHSKKIIQRDLSITHFDVTNYYFDVRRSDIDTLGSDGTPVDKNGKPVDPHYHKRGPEKNHRPDPIIGMGLLTDRRGLPIAYDLFPGNESEKVHMLPVIRRVKEAFSNSRTIVVADRGLNTFDNIFYLNGDNRGSQNIHDGYVYGQSVRSADAQFKEWVLTNTDKDPYITTEFPNPKDPLGDKIKFTHKSRIEAKTLHINYTNDKGEKKKKAVIVDQKQLVYYSEKYAKKQKMDRDRRIEHANDLIKHPDRYTKASAAGSASYVVNIAYDKETGIVADGLELHLDTAKIEEEEKYDGYYSIVTSELNMSDIEMGRTYHGLHEIEETFKISKSDFETRPVYVQRNDHIEGHFATCFTALMLLRLLQLKLEPHFPAEQIISALRKYNCTSVDSNGTLYKFLYNNNVVRAWTDAFGRNYSQRYRTRLEVRRLLKY